MARRASLRTSVATEAAPPERADRRWRSATGPRLEALGAVAAARVHPVLLDEEVAAAQPHVRDAAARRGVRRAEGPRALVGVLVATIVVPGVEVGVGHGLLQLVGDDGRRSVRAHAPVGRLRSVR